ncbi:hypothetical protein [Lysinibacillus fusiformis]|uniref:hypothetical protein n=1 Tax=Lysinibacillus fusiformis TaxID=28031 RepID=UPI0036EC2A7B
MADKQSEKALQSVSEAEKVQIEEIMRVSELAKDGTQLNRCQDDCDTAYDIAKVACMALSNPIATAACLVVAKRVYQECSKKC